MKTTKIEIQKIVIDARKTAWETFRKFVFVAVDTEIEEKEIEKIEEKCRKVWERKEEYENEYEKQSEIENIVYEWMENTENVREVEENSTKWEEILQEKYGIWIDMEMIDRMENMEKVEIEKIEIEKNEEVEKVVEEGDFVVYMENGDEIADRYLYMEENGNIELENNSTDIENVLYIEKIHEKEKTY